VKHDNLIIGFEHFSDAAVYRVAPDQALVQTVDFFTPIVDDPRTFGRIAAANSLSDVYAMGGRPITCLAIVGFPSDDLGSDILLEILLGGDEKVREAGALIVGGHSVKDKEIKYGLAVTGLVHPDRVRTNAGARPGDVLVLTKPLGTGVISNAIKADKASADDEGVREAIASMEQLNKAASEVLDKHGVKGATDITGFGVAGHASFMAEASGVGMVVRAGALPVIELALSLAKKPLAGGARDNEVTFGPKIDRKAGVPDDRARNFFDAQTSGGLLAAVPKDKADLVVADLKAAGTKAAAVIGECVDRSKGRIELAP
jgi:selenide,water dikinase